jgi:transposase
MSSTASRPYGGNNAGAFTIAHKPTRGFAQSGFNEVATSPAISVPPATSQKPPDSRIAEMVIQGGMEDSAMPSAVKLREDYSAETLRRLARRSKDANQSRRLLSLAAVRDGLERGEAAKIGGMDRQTLRDWVHRFNAQGPAGLLDNWTDGPQPRLTSDQLAELTQIIETGPDPKTDGVVRWRRVDLQRVIATRFGVEYHERYVGKLLHKLGFSHMSARPRHPAQDARIVEAFKKTSPTF